MPLIWKILLHFTMTPHWPAPNGWRILPFLSVLNHILGINLGLKEFVFLYEFRSDHEFISFSTRDRCCFFVTAVPAKKKLGWSRDMLKLVSTSGDLDASPSGFSPTARLLLLGYKPVPEKVNM